MSALAQPAVSVLMDVSQGEDFLDAALASLAAQTFRDFEIILCAHGTTPATEAIIAGWEAREPRLTVLRSPRLPLARAHNRAAGHARAALHARLDADDVARPDRLEQQVRMFALDPGLGFAGSAVDIVDAAGRPLSQVRNPLDHAGIAAALRSSCPIVHSSLMVRAEAFRQAGSYREGLNISEDYDLYARLIEHCRAANSAEPLIAYRVHAGSLTSRHSTRMALAGHVIRAAIAARAQGLPEPFVAGVPSLRRAAPLLGRAGADLRRDVRATAAQTRASRRLLTGFLPFRLNGWLRNAALALGLRRVYALAFRARIRLTEWLG